MNMNKLFILAAAFMMASCSQTLNVEITNPTDVARSSETIELTWAEVSALKGVTPDNVLVLDAQGEQIPSQVIFEQGEPAQLIFQVSAQGQSWQQLSIAKGVREEYTQRVYGRQVPERFDDYTWENNRIAYRMYGPALETSVEKLITPGIDIWLKSVERMVINDRYKLGDYHHDHGDGMDCYKVGKTLGGGSSVAYADGKLCPMTHNYATYEILAEGPIRHSFRLNYPAYEVNGKEVTLSKIITLDANTHFNRMQSIYEGDFEELQVVAGFVRHDVKEFTEEADLFAMREAASDTKDAEADGDIYGAVILPEGQIMAEHEGHALALTSVKPAEVMTYYSGAGWSKGGDITGIQNMEHWMTLVKECEAMAKTPLKVVVK